MKKNSKEMKKNMKGGNMRKNLIKMMVVAGAATLIIPTAAMAGWDQNESHMNQDDHVEFMGTPDFTYGMEAEVGYDSNGIGAGTTGDVLFDTSSGPLGAPDNTLPCPINVADTTGDAAWEGAIIALGGAGCPSQTGDATSPQTAPMDTEFEADVILDDLYQELTETATIGAGSTLAFKKVDQALDILFYARANTIIPWTAPDMLQTWTGGLGIDQTLDQDVADISGTTAGVTSWSVDHVAQTLYQDFELWKAGGPGASMAGEDLMDNMGRVDQWLIQSMLDRYDNTELLATGEMSDVTFAQSYSSWMVIGDPVNVCDEADSLSTTNNCTYNYDPNPHSVDKTVPATANTHETADP